MLENFVQSGSYEDLDEAKFTAGIQFHMGLPVGLWRPCLHAGEGQWSRSLCAQVRH